MTRLSDFRIINTLLVFAVGVVLAGCGGGGGGAAPTPMPPTNVGRNPTPMPPVVVTPPVAVMPPVVAMTPMLQTFDAGTPTAAELTGAGGNDVWTIAGDVTGNSPALDINGLIQAGGGEAIGGLEADEHSAAFTLSGGAVDVSIVYGTTTEATYTLEGGTFAPTILGAITSGFASNTFILAADVTGDTPALRLGGAFINRGASGEFRINSGGVAGRIEFTDTPLGGSIGLQNIDTITIDGGTADVISAEEAGESMTF